MVSSVVTEAIADVLASGKTDVAGAVIVVQDVDAALCSKSQSWSFGLILPTLPSRRNWPALPAPGAHSTSSRSQNMP